MPPTGRSSLRQRHSSNLHKYKKTKGTSPNGRALRLLHPPRTSRARATASGGLDTALAQQQISILEDRVSELQSSLLDVKRCHLESMTRLASLQLTLGSHKKDLQHSQEQLRDATRKLDARRKALARARKREAALTSDRSMLRDELKGARQMISSAHEREAEALRLAACARNEAATAGLSAMGAYFNRQQADSQSIAELTGAVAISCTQVESLQKELKGSRKKVKAIQMQYLRASRARKKAEERMRVAQLSQKRARTWKLTNKGTYTPDARRAARLLQKAGCSQAMVGPTIVELARVFGITVKRTMSRRTVQRALAEGGIASKVQVAYELSQAKGFTASSDGTSHRKINYEARHVNLLVPSYHDPLAPAVHRTRLVGVDQALDHTSETQFVGWKSSVAEMSELLDEAPFAKDEGISFQPDDFARKLKGMHGDHASDQLKTARAMQAWKTAVAQKDLGLARMVSMPVEELDQRTSKAIDSEIDACGGQEAWSSLDNADRLERVNSALSGLALMLGTEAMAELPPEEERALLFFVRGGCCMHKDLNSVKGGNDAMQAEWKKIGAQPPLLLANKANAATLELSAATDAAAVLAADVSARGGVKLTSLAGAIFNNKDDKKGHQDIHRWHFEQVKRRLEDKKCSIKFPSTSNTRFQSHCDGAGELVTYCSEYIAFLEDIRDNKEKRNFNHIELNVYNALHDIPTLTELAVLVLYAQVITHPYMRLVRGPGVESVNLLDLGPLHQDLRTHISEIIADPDAVLDSLGLEEEHWKTATLDQKPWMNPKAIEAIASLKPNLPHLKTMLVAFMRGALETWERFSAEFMPGSLIDTASDAERDLAYMPSTNDSNEGTLGQMRRNAQARPSETSQHQSARASFHRNDTQDFMDAKFGEDDHRFVMLKAREVDASKAPAKFRAELMARQRATANGKRKQDEARASKKTELYHTLSQVVLVFEQEAVLKLSVKQLEQQLEVYRVVKCDSEVPIKARLKNKEAKREALFAAISRSKSSPAESDGSVAAVPETSHAGLGEDQLMDQDDDEEVLYYQK